MRFPILSIVAAVALLAAPSGAATSSEVLSSAPSVELAPTPPTDVELISISGPASASYTVQYFDGSSGVEEIYAGSIGESGSVTVATPAIGVGLDGLHYAVVHVYVSGDESIAAVQTVDPLFLWQ